MEAESHGPELRTPRSIHGKVTRMTARDNGAEPMTTELAQAQACGISWGAKKQQCGENNDQASANPSPTRNPCPQEKISGPSVKGRGRGRS